MPLSKLLQKQQRPEPAILRLANATTWVLPTCGLESRATILHCHNKLVSLLCCRRLISSRMAVLSTSLSLRVTASMLIRFCCKSVKTIICTRSKGSVNHLTFYVAEVLQVIDSLLEALSVSCTLLSLDSCSI